SSEQASITLNEVYQHPKGEVMGLKPIVSEVCSQGYPESAICVQRFDDSLNSAIRITYRISLRSSSLREPRYPLLTVVRLRPGPVREQVKIVLYVVADSLSFQGVKWDVYSFL